MEGTVEEFVVAATGASSLGRRERIQSLWSGYGSIVRYRLEGAELASVIVKQVRLSERAMRSRGGGSDFAHQRKVKSYAVETTWYESWSEACGERCRVPRCLGTRRGEDEVLMILEDLDAAGYARRLASVSEDAVLACIDWLAHFHATFMGRVPEGLWESGTYWHLGTRPEELAVLEDGWLKQAAPLIDQALSAGTFQTVLHGDAKLENFCFAADGRRVAAVDFQYVGGGCGMKDLAYFVDSCLSEEDAEASEECLLDAYFERLAAALRERGAKVSAASVEEEWRPLYAVAWADFHRFLKGWSPGVWKASSYSERVAAAVARRLLGRT